MFNIFPFIDNSQLRQKSISYDRLQVHVKGLRDAIETSKINYQNLHSIVYNLQCIIDLHPQIVEECPAFITLCNGFVLKKIKDGKGLHYLVKQKTLGTTN